MTHDTAKHIQLLVPGIFFGYTFDTVAGTYAQLFYCGAGVYFRPCNEKDVNFSKYFDHIIISYCFCQIPLLIEITASYPTF